MPGPVAAVAGQSSGRDSIGDYARRGGGASVPARGFDSPRLHERDERDERIERVHLASGRSSRPSGRRDRATGIRIRLRDGPQVVLRSPLDHPKFADEIPPSRMTTPPTDAGGVVVVRCRCERSTSRFPRDPAGSRRRRRRRCRCRRDPRGRSRRRRPTRQAPRTGPRRRRGRRRSAPASTCDSSRHDIDVDVPEALRRPGRGIRVQESDSSERRRREPNAPIATATTHVAGAGMTEIARPPATKPLARP